MKIVETLGAQGEIRMFRIDRIPDHATPVEKAPSEEYHVIGHSETGHHHVLAAERVRVYQLADEPEGMRVLYAILESPGELRHLREYDKHAPHVFETGDIIMFRRDRELDPRTLRASGVID